MPSPRPRPATPALLLAVLACTPSAPPPASEPATRSTKPDPAATRPAAAPVAPPPEALTADERAAAGGRIVFLAERPDGATIDELSPTGGPTRTLLKGPPAAGPTIFPGPLAPDGAHMIVVTVDEQDGVHRERLELRPRTDAGLGEPIWRSDAAEQARNPSWSPDGRFFAFEASFTSFRDIYRVDLSPGTPPTQRRLTDHPAGNYEPAISPDGQKIAFVSSRDGNAEVYVMQADGAAPTRLTDAVMDDFGPRWSPDGGTLAFLSNRDGADRIYLCRPDGSELHRLTRDVPRPDQSFEPGEAEPTFSPDGNHLAYSVRTGPMHAALRLVDLTSGAVTDLTPGTASDREPVWSPRGDLLLFASDRDGDPELYLVRRDGRALARLTERPGTDWLPRWSPR